MVGREPGYPTNNGERGEVIATLSQEEILGLATQSLVNRRVGKDQERIGYSNEAHEQDREELDWLTEAKRTDIFNSPSSDMKLVYKLYDLGSDNGLDELPKRLDEKIENASKEVLRHEIDYGILSILKKLEGGSSTTYVIAQAYDNLNPEEKPLNPAKPNRYISSRDPIGQQFRRIETALLTEEQRQNLTTQSLNEAKEKLIGITKQRLDELGVSSYVSVVAHKDSKNPGYEYVTLLSTKSGVVAEALSDPAAVLRERAEADLRQLTAAYNYKEYMDAVNAYEHTPKIAANRKKLYEYSTKILQEVIDRSIKEELGYLLRVLGRSGSLDSIASDSLEELYRHDLLARLRNLHAEDSELEILTESLGITHRDNVIIALTGPERRFISPEKAIDKIKSVVSSRLTDLGIDYLHTVVRGDPETDDEIVIYLSCAQNSA